MTAAFCGEQIFKHLGDGRFYCLLMDNSDTSPAIDMVITNRYEGMMTRKMIERPSSLIFAKEHEVATADARL